MAANPQKMESAEWSVFDRATLTIVARVAPFMVVGGFVFARRTKLFHAHYLRRALRRPIAQHLSANQKQAQHNAPNPEFLNWLKRSLGEQQERGIHVASGITGYGRSTTAINYLAKKGTCGLYLDLLALRSSKDINDLLLDLIINQSSFLAKFLPPLNWDLRTSLPFALRPWPWQVWIREKRVFNALLAPVKKPVIIVNHAENLFKHDDDDFDASWFLWLLIEISNHAHVLVLCSNKAAVKHIQPSDGYTTFSNMLFCPVWPRDVLQRKYIARLEVLSLKLKEEAHDRVLSEPERNQLGSQMAELFQRAPAVANIILSEMAAGRSVQRSVELAISHDAKLVAERLGLGRPSAYISTERAEELLSRVECLLNAMFGEQAQRDLVQEHDAATRRLIELKFFSLETAVDGDTRLHIRGDCSIIRAFSGPAVNRSIRSLMRTIQNSVGGDQEQLRELATSVEKLLSMCPEAMKRLDEVLGKIGSDDVDDWNSALRRWRSLSSVKSDELYITT